MFTVSMKNCFSTLNGTVRQIEKALINDRLTVSKLSWKFSISTIYNSAVVYRWNFANFLKSTLLLTVAIIFFVHKQNFTAP